MKHFSKRGILGLLGAVLITGAICFALFTWMPSQSSPQTTLEQEEVIPPERRHDYLDVTVVNGLRYRYPGRGWDVSVGSVEVRRRSLGFIRIGAFNEALIRDMHITLMPEFNKAEVIALFRNLADAPAEGDIGAPPGRHPRQLGFFLEALGVRSPHADTRVSSLRVRNLSLRFAPGDQEPDVVYFQASSAHLRGGELRMNSGISFRTRNGQQIHCREARLSFREPPMFSLREAVVYSNGVTRAVDRLSFPFSALLHDEDLLSYAD